MSAIPSSSLKAILGPTNTGKTHFAIERMLAHRSGMIGLPLRLLAREVYSRVAERVGADAVALVTGEERVVPARPRYWVATVEAMPTDMPVECLAIDEIQTATDFDRGHVFTERMLHARGMSETLLLGAGTMAPVIRALLPQAEIIHRPRFSELTYAGSKKVSRQPRRSAIVAFSAARVYAIAELIRRERGGAAVVMGALSPRTRNAQVALYQNGDVDFLVATDAIGMGLNLDIGHVAFADDTKFDGRQSRPLTPAEFGQIAGRAGRHMRNGTFGVTAGTEEFEPELVVALETHDFEPVRLLQWRNNALDFSSIAGLVTSLEAAPEHKALTRVPIATDQRALDFLARNEAGGLAKGRDAVALLWQVCQTPDYVGVSPAAHGEILTRIYCDLVRRGAIDTDWIAEQVRFCDNAHGDIDTLSSRIRQIRTWTFVANRKDWLEDPAHWRETTRDIEDRLSDALHDRLTQRFVDRRTSVLIRHLKDTRMASPEINERGEVSLEGHLIGTIEGFRFTLARAADGVADAKALRSAADQAVAPEIRNRADRLAGAPNEEFVLATDGRLRWKGEIVAELAEGDALLRPRVIVLADESLTGSELERVQDRLELWLRHHVNTVLEQVMALEAPADLDGSARGIAYRLYENLGILPRAEVADEVNALDQDVRGKLRKLGVKFGAYHIYVPMSLKPAPRELALILFALKTGGVRQPGVPDLPHVVLSGRTSIEADPAIAPRLYEIAGFKLAGRRAVRIDILERLADIIRPLVALDAGRHEGELPPGAAEGNGFRVTVEMTSLLGCAGEDFNSILTALGYRVRRTPKPAAPPAGEAPAPDAPVDDIAAPEAGVGETQPDTGDARTDGEKDGSAEPVSATAEAVGDEGALETTPIETMTGAETAPTDDGVTAETSPVSEPAASPDEAAHEGAVAQDSESAVAPAEPAFDEIWFPGGRRPDNRRHQQDRRGPKRRPAPGEVEQPDRGRGDKRGKPQRRPDRPDRQERAPAERRFERPARDKREKPFDPDSPFAALAALKTSKSD